jgi:hypothetical protein
MTRRNAPACALALVLLDVAAAWCQDPTTSGSLPCRTQFVRFEILQGRLTASAVSQTQNRAASAAHPSGLPAETLTATGPCEKPTVRYERVCAREALLIDIVRGTEVSITREPRGEAKTARVMFEQVTGKDLLLSVEKDGKEQKYAGPSLWHLLLAEREVCREHLLPVLARLRSDWVFERRAANLEAALVDLYRSGAIEQRRRCAALVDQLSAGSFQARQQADRELRGMGQLALSYFSRLDPTRLDSEQRQRLKKIADDLAVFSGDTPERAAAWMLDDKSIWLALLAHEAPEYRHTAALQLSRICDRPIEFDPAAAEIERKAQIERLRERLAKGM